jgi:hypothetical protein
MTRWGQYCRCYFGRVWWGTSIWNARVNSCRFRGFLRIKSSCHSVNRRVFNDGYHLVLQRGKRRGWGWSFHLLQTFLCLATFFLVLDMHVVHIFRTPSTVWVCPLGGACVSIPPPINCGYIRKFGKIKHYYLAKAFCKYVTWHVEGRVYVIIFLHHFSRSSNLTSQHFLYSWPSMTIKSPFQGEGHSVVKSRNPYFLNSCDRINSQTRCESTVAYGLPLN